MDKVIIESFPVLRKSQKGNIFARCWDGLNQVEIQFHNAEDVKALVTACGNGAFTAEKRDYGPDKKWTEYVGPRCTVEFTPTGKSEDGSAIFAHLESAKKSESLKDLDGFAF